MLPNFLSTRCCRPPMPLAASGWHRPAARRFYPGCELPARRCDRRPAMCSTASCESDTPCGSISARRRGTIRCRCCSAIRSRRCRRSRRPEFAAIVSVTFGAYRQHKPGHDRQILLLRLFAGRLHFVHAWHVGRDGLFDECVFAFSIAYLRCSDRKWGGVVRITTSTPLSITFL